MCVDSLGRPLRFILTGGERNDCTQALDLIRGFKASYVLADKGYDTTEIVEAVEDAGAIAVIPPRKSRTHQRHYDKNIYKKRNLVERTFGKLKQFRRLATRYDRKSSNFLAFIYLASLNCWVT